MFNFSRLFDRAEGYISQLGVVGGVGGMIGLYALGGIRNFTVLGVVGGSAIIPPLVMEGSSASNELLMDGLIIAGPVLSMMYYGIFSLDMAFYFASGALLLQAVAATINNKRK